MWWLNLRRNQRVLAQSEEYHEAQTELHQRYEDWVAISRISSLGLDAGKLADRFESSAREAAAGYFKRCKPCDRLTPLVFWRARRDSNSRPLGS